MSDPQTPGNWWQTLPGVLTALAGVITAVGGLVALLYQHGVFSQHGDAAVASAPTPSEAKATAAPPQQVPKPVPPQAPHQVSHAVDKAWSDSVAVVVGRDGRETRLRADSLSNCISANHELTLASGQSVDFERMASFEVQHADPHTASTAKARLQITLLDGGTVSDSVDANCDLFGFNDVGRFATFFDQIRMVRFER